MQKYETAAQAYTRNIKDILENLDLIKEWAVVNRNPTDNTNWGDVGSAAFVREKLEEITEFLNITDD